MDGSRVLKFISVMSLLGVEVKAYNVYSKIKAEEREGPTGLTLNKVKCVTLAIITVLYSVLGLYVVMKDNTCQKGRFHTTNSSLELFTYGAYMLSKIFKSELKEEEASISKTQRAREDRELVRKTELSFASVCIEGCKENRSALPDFCS
jgi:hypothetical protein